MFCVFGRLFIGCRAIKGWHAAFNHLIFPTTKYHMLQRDGHTILHIVQCVLRHSDMQGEFEPIWWLWLVWPLGRTLGPAALHRADLGSQGFWGHQCLCYHCDEYDSWSNYLKNNKLCQAKAKYTEGETDGYWIFDQIEDDRVKFPLLFWPIFLMSGYISGEKLLYRQFLCQPWGQTWGAR